MGIRVLLSARRKGTSIIECLVLLVVLTITLTSLLSTVEWGSKMFLFAKNDLDSRMLYSTWVEVFESIYPNSEDDPKLAFASVAKIMGAKLSSPELASIKGKSIEMGTPTTVNGIISIGFSIKDQRRVLFSHIKRYNTFSNETVSDDSYGN